MLFLHPLSAGAGKEGHIITTQLTTHIQFTIVSVEVLINVLHMQGWKLGVGAQSRGLPQILQQLPQSAGSPKPVSGF